MKNRLTIFLIGYFILFTSVYAEKEPLRYENGEATIELKDYLDHPFYWWPKTLLSYPIRFEQSVDLDQLVLIDQVTNKQVPFQLSDVSNEPSGISGVLHLISDLPSNGVKKFILKQGEPEAFTPLNVSADEHLQVDTDVLSVQLPLKSTQENLPGPIVAFKQKAGEWMGRSVFEPGEREIRSLKSTVVDKGPLFVKVIVDYEFNDGATYRAEVRCVRGYEFVEIKEWMEGFEDGKDTYWRIYWDGFTPTHRQAPNHPWTPYKGENKEPGFNRYTWERIDQMLLGNHHGVRDFSNPEGKIPFEIGIYDTWPAEGTVSSSVFWDENSDLSMGAFIKNTGFWNDREFAIWHPTGKLAINFYYKDDVLSYKYPVFSGTRSSTISSYNHQKDIQYMEDLDAKYRRTQHPKGFNYGVRISQLSYNTFLQNRYSTIDLNKVKDWQLGYDKNLKLAPVVFEKSTIETIDDLEKRFIFGSYSNELAFSGPCQNSGYSPVPARSFYEHYVPAYNKLLPKMNAEERNRFAAMFQLHTYMAVGEEYMPMKIMLSGHPNFLADVKGIPGMAAFLFPDHPDADEWANLFEKYVDLNTHYHTRPDVKSWDALGGRWTENLGTYIWAFLKPTIRSNYLLQSHYDGKNRLANEQTRNMGRYVLGTLSAPYNGESLEYYNKDGKLDMHSWGVITKEKGPARVHPPQGAHAMRRQPPNVFWRLGKDLENYDPVLAENIQFVSKPYHDGMESLGKEEPPFSIITKTPKINEGTPPDFKSAKYTGYGIILRAAVGTPDELSIHLSQIDPGHNYRWGKIADGGCGSIYFYAGGKSYSHNGKEDSGDRRLQDTDHITNFGAYKDGAFKTIGQNVLSSPLYDLGTGQFAEITSSKERDYSWPEYNSRSIMLVGSDYFVTYDDVFNARIGTRFSWFTHINEDLPDIQVIRGNGTGHAGEGSTAKVSITGKESKGVWFDSTDDFMALITHKDGFSSEPSDFGGIVTTPEGTKDYLFRSDKTVTVDQEGIKFKGTAGFIRKLKGGEEWNLFHGQYIGNDLVTITVSHENAGISALYAGGTELSGHFYSPEKALVTFRGDFHKSVKVFIDGVDKTKRTGNELVVEFPAGQHIWQLSKGDPVPPRPVIAATINQGGKVSVEVSPVAGASKYQFEYSIDQGKTWKMLQESKQPAVLVTPESDEEKGYVRVFAKNKTQESEASIIYPLYFTEELPTYPDGLKADILSENIELTWGKVLGCKEYILYRRKSEDEAFEKVYQGTETVFSEMLSDGLYEYAVSAINGNGESKMSKFISTDPDSWLNFEPFLGEPFRRTRNSIGYDKSEMYYPE